MLFYYFHSHHSPSSIVLMIWNSWRDKVQFQPANLRFFLLIAIDYYGFNKALIHFLCKIVIVLRMYCKHSATYIAITCTIYSKRIAGLIALPSFFVVRCRWGAMCEQKAEPLQFQELFCCDSSIILSQKQVTHSQQAIWMLTDSVTGWWITFGETTGFPARNRWFPQPFTSPRQPFFCARSLIVVKPHSQNLSFYHNKYHFLLVWLSAVY